MTSEADDAIEASAVPATTEDAGNLLLQIFAWIGAIGLCLAIAGGAVWLVSGMVRSMPIDGLRGAPERRIEVVERVEPAPLPPASAMDQNGNVIVNPTWAVRPAPEYPRTAMDVDSGAVQLECVFAPSGQVTACTVLSETPAGKGFGRAAIAAAYKARIRPTAVDGVPTGGKIRFNNRFALG
ncbi:hypothetical protein BH09PSE1_BH09PSE1_18740 [soil metagenome]